MSPLFRSCQPLVLASASPRRREYLAALGLDFQVATAEIDERPRPGELPEPFVRRMAVEKVRLVAKSFPESWVLGGDTVVCLDDAILGKPRHGEEAVAMLLSLAGRSHLVRSAFCLASSSRGEEVIRSLASRVHFTPFSEELARAYLATGEPLDKAGAYGIQGVGAMLVAAVEGSYTNIVGLPLAELVVVLRDRGVIALAGPG